MSFEYEEGRMYMMPVVFGPAVTPRHNKDGKRFIYDKPTKTTHYRVVCEVSAEKLEIILPKNFKLLGPYVIVTFSALRDIAWLAGRGYDILHIEIPVVFKGEERNLIGNFEPVLWENLCDAILTGREQLGYSKIYGDIDTMTESGNIARGSISTFGFKFLEMEVDLSKDPEDKELLQKILFNPDYKGKLHYKYFPATEAPFSKSDAEYVCFGPNDWNPPADCDISDCPKAESVLCRGKLIWAKPKWEEAPTQAHIISFLCEMGFKRYIGAQKQVVYSHNDIYEQRRIY